MQQLVNGDIDVYDGLGDEAMSVLNASVKNRGVPDNRSINGDGIVRPPFVCTYEEDGSFVELGNRAVEQVTATIN